MKKATLTILMVLGFSAAAQAKFEINCDRDWRPRDGQKSVLKISPTAEGYRASLHEEWNSFGIIGSSDVDLGTNLNCTMRFTPMESYPVQYFVRLVSCADADGLERVRVESNEGYRVQISEPGADGQAPKVQDLQSGFHCQADPVEAK